MIAPPLRIRRWSQTSPARQAPSRRPLHRLFGWIALAVSLTACGSGLDTFRITETATTVVPKGTLVEELVGGLGFDGFTDMDLTSNQSLANQGV